MHPPPPAHSLSHRSTRSSCRSPRVAPRRRRAEPGTTTNRRRVLLISLTHTPLFCTSLYCTTPFCAPFPPFSPSRTLPPLSLPYSLPHPGFHTERNKKPRGAASAMGFAPAPCPLKPSFGSGMHEGKKTRPKQAQTTPSPLLLQHHKPQQPQRTRATSSTETT